MKTIIKQMWILFLLAVTISGCSFSVGDETSDENTGNFMQTGASQQEAIEIQYEELGKLVTREFGTGGYYWFKVPYGLVSSKMRVVLRHAGHDQYTYTGITGGYTIYASDGTTELVKNEGLILTYEPLDIATAEPFYIRVALYAETPGSFGLYVGNYYDSMPSITTIGNAVVSENSTGMLEVKLSSPPEYNIEVIVELSASSAITLNTKKLQFDSSNWDTVQYITYSVGAISDTSQKSEQGSIYLEGLGTKELLSLSSEYGSKIYDITIMKPMQWTQATTNAAFGGRYNHCSVVFNNKMWVLGGKNDTELKSDVWSSADGTTWTMTTATPGWSAREQLACTVYDNKIWIFGGGYKNDVWNSVDGVTWNQVTAAATWASRYDACALSYSKNLLDPEKMWILGGASYKDTWHSTDGTNWTMTTSAAPYSGNGHKCLVFADKMWVIGGGGIYKSDPNNNTGYYIDVWSSTDGITWNDEDPSTNGYPLGQFKKNHAAAVFENIMFALGGERYDSNSSSTIVTNDIVISTDGTQWNMLQKPTWTERKNHTALVFNNKLWIIGGYANPSYSTHAQTDVWSASFQ